MNEPLQCTLVISSWLQRKNLQAFDVRWRLTNDSLEVNYWR